MPKNLFDKEFFPTPNQVISKMAEPYAQRLHTATILEPSAGNGAILDFITSEGASFKVETSRGYTYETTAKADNKRVYAIERNPELRMILQQKGYRVLATDFLTFQPEHLFDLILMNPPFSNGDDHLLHAWEILRSGDITCLLNAETLRNPCTAARRRLAAIIREHGSTEQLGQAFKTADNPTDVEVILVRLHKEANDDPFRIATDNLTKESAPDFGEIARESNQVAVNDQLGAYIRCWERTKKSAMELIRSYAQFRFYTNTFLPKNERGENVTEGMLKLLGDIRYNKDSMASVYNQFLDRTKESAWNSIFTQIGIEKYMTTGLRQKLDEFRTAQGALEINRENIGMLFNFIMNNINTIMDGCVSDVYDIFTRYHKDNTSHEEGWKTNKRFMANRKIILPDSVNAGYKPEIYGYRETFSTEYHATNTFNDIDKAMCWLSGQRHEDLNGKNADTKKITDVINEYRVGDTSWQPSAFFLVKCFKKGTVHLQFRDEALWTKFNLTVNKEKNRIGMAE